MILNLVLGFGHLGGQWIGRPVILGLLIYLSAWQAAEATNICLFYPLVTDLSIVNAKSTKLIPPYPLSIHLTLNNEFTVEIEDAFIKSDGHLDSKRTRLILLPNSQTLPITYFSDYQSKGSESFLTIRVDKRVVRQRASSLISGTKLSAATKTAKPCGSAYIYDTSFYVALNGIKFIEVKYRKGLRCFGISNDGQTPEEFKLVTHTRSSRSTPTNVVAANYFRPFLFEFTADGHLLAYKFHSGQEPSESNPIGGDIEFIDHWSMLPFSQARDYKHPLVDSEYCRRAASNIGELDLWTKFLLDVRKPFRTLFRLKDGMLYGSDANARSSLAWIYSWPNPKSQIKLPKPNDTDMSTSSLEVASSSFQQTPDDDTVHAIYSQLAGHRILYTYNCSASYCPYEYLDDPIIPDDITHWHKCQKIVSVYGFMYTLHNFTDNILRTPSKWQLLDEEFFDLPVQAMHAEGDEFWFLFGVLRATKMRVDSSDCSKLKFVSSKKMHLNQLLMSFDSNQLELTESRYFDGKKWIPPLPQINPSPIDDETGKDSPFLIFIVLGVIVTLIVVVIVSFMVIRTVRFAQQADIIYSRSANSKVALKSSAPKLDLPTPSSIPVFSHAPKSIKIHSSRSSADARRHRRSPRSPRSPNRVSRSSPRTSVSSVKTARSPIKFPVLPKSPYRK